MYLLGEYFLSYTYTFLPLYILTATILWNIDWITSRKHLLFARLFEINNLFIAVFYLFSTLYSFFQLIPLLFKVELGMPIQTPSYFVPRQNNYFQFFVIFQLITTFFSQLFWVKKVRANKRFTAAIAGLFFMVLFAEKFAIIIISLHKDYLPSYWEVAEGYSSMKYYINTCFLLTLYWISLLLTDSFYYKNKNENLREIEFP